MKIADPVFTTLDDAQCRALLMRQRVGRLAYALHDHVDIEPVHFAFDGDWIYGRTSMGTKLATLVHRPWCAFEVDEVRGLFDWTSVVVKGSFHMLDPESGSPDAYRRAVDRLTALIPGTFSTHDPVPHRTIIFGIYVQEMAGRSASTDSE